MTRVDPREIIKTYNKTGSVAKISRLPGISRITVYRWLKQSKSIYSRLHYSIRNLKRKSTRPRTIHYALTNEENVKIEELKEKCTFHLGGGIHLTPRETSQILIFPDTNLAPPGQINQPTRGVLK